MARHIDNVIGAGHDKYVAIVVDISRVAGLVVTGIPAEIGLHKTILCMPEGGKSAWG